jgi:DNA-binding PadR family transcriptional regulator
VYKDSLIPSEAIRLAALGILAQGPKSYTDLSAEVRHFADRIVGPSLDLLGPSLELLRVEGLVAADGAGPAAEAAILRITEEGRRELLQLLRARLRGPLGDVGKLLIALKMRFLHLLDPAERRAELEQLAQTCDTELKRLKDLRAHHDGEAGALLPWLDHDIAQIAARAAWLRDLARGM